MSNRNASPVPSAPITIPPSAGPASLKARGSKSCCSEFAWTMRAGGTTSGTIAWNDGANSACPIP